MISTTRRSNAPVITIMLAALAAVPAFAQLPVVSITPGSLTYLYQGGGGVPAAQTASITSTAAVSITSATVNYSAGPTGWITVFPPVPPTVATPAAITVYLTPAVLATLSNGVYAAQVSFNFSTAVDPSSTTTVGVFLTVTGSTGGNGGGTAPNETITASPANLSFSYSVGGSVPSSLPVSISTSDNANYTSSVTTNDGAQWLSVSPVTGPTPGTMNVSVNPVGLAGGSYNGTITVQGPNSVVQVPVYLSVGGISLGVSPTSLAFNIPQNYGVGASQYLQVTAPAVSTFQAFGSSDNNWLLVDTPSGKTPGTVTVRANDSSLAQGTYNGMVTVQTSPSNAVQVPVTLTVGAPATLQISPTIMSFSYTLGNSAPPAQTVNVKALGGSTQAYTASTTTTDGASWLIATPSGPSAPGTLAVSVNASALTVGSYTGVVNLLSSATGSSPQPVQVSLTVLPAPTPTVVSVGSAASYVSGTVAPGEFVTLFGSALGPATLVTPTPGTAPKTLGGTVVTFDGIPAPILYASATQTSVQVPYGIQIPQTVMQVQRNGSVSTAANVASLPTFPSLFTSDTSGKGQVAALNSDYSVNSASNPAARGSAIALYGTGEGKTNPSSVEGTITPGVQPLPQPLYPVTATVGGVAAQVVYSGETPTALAGLMQINVIIPASVTPGSSVPVVVTINGQSSQATATIAVK